MQAVFFIYLCANILTVTLKLCVQKGHFVLENLQTIFYRKQVTYILVESLVMFLTFFSFYSNILSMLIFLQPVGVA